MQERQCEQDECKTEVIWQAVGRKPRYCHEHQDPKYAKARQRARDKSGRPERPACCEAAGRRHGRQACPQHNEPHSLNHMPEIMHLADYAGSVPRPKDRGRAPEMLPYGTYRVTSSPAMISGQWMTQRHTHNGAPIRVIGQRDLTHDWKVSEHEDAKAMTGLVSRGPDWPWAEDALAVAA